MELLLDLDYKKKYNLLKEIYCADQSAITRAQLAKNLSISKRTIVNTIESINNDIRKFNFEKKIKLRYNNNTSLYKLEIAEDFSLKEIYRAFLTDSVKFNIMLCLLNTTTLTGDNLSKKLFITPSFLKKEIKELNTFLSKINITIKTKGNLKIYGNELTIRFLYANLFTSAFTSWPFKFINHSEVTKIINLLPSDLHTPCSVDKIILLYYYFGISIFRIRKKNYMRLSDTKAPLYEAYTPSMEREIATFNSELQKHVPNITQETLQIEGAFLCSSTISLGSFSEINKPSPFFTLNSVLQKNNFLNKLVYLLDIVSKYTIEPISIQEYNLILYRLCTIHYRSTYLGRGIINAFPEWNHPTNTDLIPPYKRRRYSLFNNLIATTLSKVPYPEFDENKCYFINQYIKVIDQCLPANKYDPKIKIVFLSLFSNKNIKNQIYDYFKPYINIEIIEHFDKSTDLIISDTLLSNDIRKLFGSSSKIVYVNSQPSDIDLKNITKTINNICTKKIEAYVSKNSI